MLRNSLVTLEGELEFAAFVEPSFAFGASLSLSLIALSFLLPLGGCVHACRPEGLPEGLHFLERECVKNNSLKPYVLVPVDLP